MPPRGHPRHASEVATRGEPDETHARYPVLSKPPDLRLKSVQWYRMPDSQWVAEYAGFQAKTPEPFDDRFTFVGRVLGVAPAGQHNHVSHGIGHWRNREVVIREAMPSAPVPRLTALRWTMPATVPCAIRADIAQTCDSSGRAPSDHSVMR